MGTKIITYSQEDIKKDGSFKKKNNIKQYDQTNFFIYLKENNLSINSNYIDITGNISNGLRFRCSFNGLVIGTSGIVKDFN